MNSDRGSVLIVDDDLPSRTLLRHYLTRHGFEVTEAATGEEALGWLRQERFDLVLLDVEMPGLGGLEVLRALRQMQPPAELPVMMATVKDDTSDIVVALDAGANDYVTKPFNLPVVLARARMQVSLRQTNRALALANERMRQELAAAARVQEALLPATLPRLPGAEFAWHYRPCAELAGDLLGLVPLTDRQICLYVLDVVHHGVKAALLAVMINRVLSRLLAGGGAATSPAEVATYLNREFPWDDRTEQFFTLLLGVLDTPTGEFRFVSAGHPGPLRLSSTGESEVLRRPGDPIGLCKSPYEEHHLHLRRGERLYLFTDGLPEARNSERRPFGENRCSQVLAAARSLSLAEGLGQLVRAIEEWTAPHAPHDDISLAAVELV